MWVIGSSSEAGFFGGVGAAGGKDLRIHFQTKLVLSHFFSVVLSAVFVPFVLFFTSCFMADAA